MSQPPRDHDRLDELAALDALGGLDDAEQRELAAILAAHGPDCPDCLRLRTAHADTAADLASALDPVPPSAGAADRLLAAATRGPARRADQPTPTRRPRLTRRVLALAAAVALLAAGIAIGYNVRPETSAPAGTAVADYLAQPGAQLAAFPAADGQRLAVLYRPGTAQGWIIGANLPAPPAGHVYELWSQPAGSTAMRPAGTFTTGHNGAVRAPADLASSFTALAVTIEPSGGSPHPTTQPIYTTTVPA